MHLLKPLAAQFALGFPALWKGGGIWRKANGWNVLIRVHGPLITETNRWDWCYIAFYYSPVCCIWHMQVLTSTCKKIGHYVLFSQRSLFKCIVKMYMYFNQCINHIGFKNATACLNVLVFKSGPLCWCRKINPTYIFCILPSSKKSHLALCPECLAFLMT